MGGPLLIVCLLQLVTLLRRAHAQPGLAALCEANEASFADGCPWSADGNLADLADTGNGTSL